MSTTTAAVGIESLAMLTLVVDDFEDALEFYVDTLGFEKRSDEPYEFEGGEGRWVTVGLPGDALDISLARPDEEFYDEATRQALSGMQGKLWWTFRTEDCEASVDALEAADVEITQPPTEYPWGVEAMFADPFGNEFSLFEFAEN